jgi:hypothetical protein
MTLDGIQVAMLLALMALQLSIGFLLGIVFMVLYGGDSNDN